MTEYFKMGIITAPHGVRGEVRVFPVTSDMQHFKKIKDCYFYIKGEYIPKKIRSCKFLKGMVILGFEDIENRDEVERLRQVEIFVDRQNASPLGEGEYYMKDLEGASAYSIDEANDSETVYIGKVTGYVDTPVHPVIVILEDDGKEHLVPAIPEFVKKVDVAAGEIYIKLIRGM